MNDGGAERLHDADEQLAPVGRPGAGRTDRRSTGRSGRRRRPAAPSRQPCSSSRISHAESPEAQVRRQRPTADTISTVSNDDQRQRSRGQPVHAGRGSCCGPSLCGGRPRSRSSRSSRSRCVAGRLRTIQHHAEDALAPDRLDGALAPASYGVESGLHDEHRAVDHRRQQVGVGQQRHRRRVDDDPVERSRASSSSRRIRSEVKPAIGSDVGRPAGRIARVGDTWCTGSLSLFDRRQPVGQAAALSMPEDRVQRRPAQVGVDQQHAALIRLAEGQRQVRRPSASCLRPARRWRP